MLRLRPKSSGPMAEILEVETRSPLAEILAKPVDILGRAWVILVAKLAFGAVKDAIGTVMDEPASHLAEKTGQQKVKPRAIQTSSVSIPRSS